MAPKKSSTPSPLRGKYDSIREQLLADGTYLGDGAFSSDKFVWRRIGIDDCLVTKESADAVDAARAGLASHDADDTQETTNSFQPLVHETAVLSAVVRITSDDFWMAACGNWKGPTTYCSTIANLKLTCTGTAPHEVPFNADYANTLKHLSAIVAQAAKLSNERGLLIERDGVRKIKFRHVLFEEKPAEDLKGGSESSDTASESEDIPVDFRIENWPYVHDAAGEAIKEIAGTHQVIPLPAYDTSSNIINPNMYRRMLQDAVVVIRFTLKHWPIRLWDTYVADIVNMRVIVQPMTCTTPTKRKVVFKDPYHSPRDAQGPSPPKRSRS